jgi:hypothetical protein
MDLVDAIKSALKAVEDAKVPEDLREKAFEKAFDWTTQDRKSSSEAFDKDGGTAARSPSRGPLAQIAEKLRIDPAVVEDVFFEDDGEVGVGIAASSLEPSKSGATRQLALLVAASRQASGLEEWTPSAAIRAVCTDYGRFDTANFASTLRGMGPVFSYRGKGQNLELRLTRPGIEQAADLVQELGGGG